MPKVLSEAQVKSYWREGYLSPLPAIPADQAESCRRKLLEFERRESVRAVDFLKMKAHLPFPWLTELVRAPAILDQVEDILGPNIMVWGSGFFVMPPNSGAWTSWHQDSTYRKYDPSELVTAWIAFTPSDRGNGGMRVIPGSHAKGQVRHQEERNDTNLLSRGQTIGGVDDSRAADIALKPGEMSFHHEMVFHSSGPNNSDRWRIGMSIHYIPPYVKTLGLYEKFGAMLVRGEDTHGYYDPDPVPAYEMDPVAVEAMQRAWRIYTSADAEAENAPPRQALER